MAFVPELDDPKDKQDQDPNASDITAQATATSSAPATGGQAVGGNPAASQTKSSGNFQDFSKFKAANANKLSALSNLTTNQAKSGVDNAKSAFDNAGSAYQTEIQKNAKNFDTSGFKGLNTNSTLDANALGKDLSEASQTVDAGSYQGKLAGDKSFTDLQSRENQVANIGNRSGTASVLADVGASNGNYSSSAANQDALLLQSMNDYRTKANELAAGVKGTTQNALTANQTKIGDTATNVNNTNKDFKTKALDALKGVKTGIDSDLTSRATLMEANRQAQIDNKSREIDQNLGNKTVNLQAEISTLKSAIPNQPTKQDILNARFLDRPDPQIAYNAAVAAYDEKVKQLVSDPATRRQQSGAQGIIDNLRQGSVSTQDILSQDTKRQSQLDALSRLLSGEDFGQTYNQGGVSAQTDLSALDNFLNQIRTNVNQPAAPVSVPASTPGAGSARSSAGGSSSRQIMK